MPNPLDTPSFPDGLDPSTLGQPDLAGDQLREQLTQETARKASEGGLSLDNLGDAAGMVGDLVEAVADSNVAAAAVDTVASSAEVAGQVLGGALEAMGSVGELAGCLDGCSGCSLAVVFVTTISAVVSVGSVLVRVMF